MHSNGQRKTTAAIVWQAQSANLPAESRFVRICFAARMRGYIAREISRHDLQQLNRSSAPGHGRHPRPRCLSCLHHVWKRLLSTALVTIAYITNTMRYHMLCYCSGDDLAGSGGSLAVQKRELLWRKEPVVCRLRMPRGVSATGSECCAQMHSQIKWSHSIPSNINHDVTLSVHASSRYTGPVCMDANKVINEEPEPAPCIG